MHLRAIGDVLPPRSALFAVDSESSDQGTRLALRGELDLATVVVLDDELRAAWARDVRCLEIDLCDLSFIGSAGIAALLEANARAAQAGCALTLVRGPAHVHHIFELTGIESRFVFRQDSALCDAAIMRSGPLGIVR